MDNVSAVKDRTNVIELISGYLPLKKAGKNYRGLCPFHSEKTPSFMVSEELQRFKCFGCGKSGDVFNFVMEMEGIDFAEALKLLADKAGVKLEYKSTKEQKAASDLKQKIIEMNELSAKFYAQLLLRHEFGKQACEYLKKRKASDETIKQFRLGYSPRSWDSLSRYLVARGYTDDDIIKAGLGHSRKQKEGTYDMFRGRLMFPLIDHLNRVIGFAGRALSDKDSPKYINTQETAIFHKERFLFGLNLAKTYIRQKNFAIIAEGEFDMIWPFQADVKNIVASKGTALTAGQANTLKRYCDTVVLVFDSDDAGIEAAIRGVEVIQTSGLNIKVAPIPTKFKDPDEMVQKDLSGFKDLIKDALPVWDYYFKYAAEKYDLSKVFERKKAADFLAGKIAKIADDVVKSEYIKKFSILFDVDEESVMKRVSKAGAEASAPARDASLEKIVKTDDELADIPAAELYILSLLTRADSGKLPIYIAGIDDEYFTSEPAALLFERLKKSAEKRKSIDIKEFYAKLQEDYPESYKLFTNVYMLDVGDDLVSDLLDAEIAKAIDRLHQSFLYRKLKELSRAIKKAEASSDTQKVKSLQAEVRKLTKQK